LEPWAQVLEQCLYGLEEGSLRALLSDADPELAEVVPAIRDRLSDRPAPHESESPEIDLDLFHDMVRLLGEVARRTPQVVVLDDRQGADPDSLLFLQFLTYQLDGLPLLVLATFCEEDLSSGNAFLDALVELGRAPATELLDLDGLDANEIGQLVATGAGGELTAGDVSTLRQCTDGNPLFVLELLRALGVDGLRALSENALRIVPVTAGVRAIVSRRLK
jgi:predicted ATPase